MNIKNFIPILIFLVLISSTMAYNVTQVSDGRLQCEVDGTCCSSLTYEIGEICWTNISWSDCPDNNYCPEAFYNYDADGETWPELHQLHGYAADWHLSNPDDMSNAKGGIFMRPRFRSYGINIVNGLNDGGGEYWDYYCDAFSCKSNSDGFSPVAYIAESEGITWNTSYFGWTALQCNDGDNCDADSNGTIDGLRQHWGALPTSNIAVVDASGYSCADCFIIEFNESLSATTWETAQTATFVLAVHPSPTNWTGVGSSSDVYLYYDAAQNEVINITYGVFRKPYASDLKDYVGNVSNYLEKKRMIRDWYNDFFDAFNYPDVQGDLNITKYYNALLSYSYDTMGCWNFSDTTSNWYVDGHCAVVNTPNKESYAALWPWDSSNTGNGILSSINYSNVNSDWVLNQTVVDWLKVWVKNDSSGVSWHRGLNEHKFESSTQTLAGWPLLVLNLYNNTNLLSDTYMETEVLPALRNQYEIKNDSDTDDDGLIGDFSSNLGRDAADIIDEHTESENTDATIWHGLFSKSLEKLYYKLGQNENATIMSKDFNRTRDNFETFWNSSCNYGNGCYWNLNTTGGFYNLGVSENDWAVSPFALAMGGILFNASESRMDYLLNDLLINNFTDPTGGYPFTSISSGHPSYDVDGGSGLTWDGPIWAGVDNFWIQQAVRYSENIDGYSLGSFDSWLTNTSISTFGIDYSSSPADRTPYGAESYNALDFGVTDASLWASNPYGWGGNILAGSINPDSILYVLADTSGGTPADVNPPTFNQSLSNLTLNNVSSGLNLWVNASDDVALDSFTVNETDFSINASGFLMNLTTLNVSLNYSILIIVNDTSNNQNSTGFYLFITFTPPVTSSSVCFLESSFSDNTTLIVGFFGLIIAVMVGVGAMTLFFNKNGSGEWIQELKTGIIIMVLVGILLAIGLIVMAGICGMF